MQCPACNNEVSPQATFCNHCGASLSPAAPSPAFTEVPPAPPAYAPPAYTPPAAGYAEVPAYTPPPTNYAPPPGSVPPTAYPPQPPAAAGSSGLSPNAAAALAYITIIPAIIFLVVEPYNKIPLVRFHSFQSIGLAVAWFAIWVCMMILHFVLHFIPFIGFLFLLVDLAVGLGFFILWLMTILKASKGEWNKLPIIGDFAMKQAQS
jgi:uncharacterized membrane protein